MMWGATPEAASPAAHEGARHGAQVTRSLVTGQEPDDDDDGNDLEDADRHWLEPGSRLVRVTGPQYCWWGIICPWPSPQSPHSASCCIICKSHIFIPPPRPRPSTERLDQARGYSEDKNQLGKSQDKERCKFFANNHFQQRDTFIYSSSSFLVQI